MLRQYIAFVSLSMFFVFATVSVAIAGDAILLAPQIQTGAVDKVEIEIEVGGKLEARRAEKLPGTPGDESETSTSPLKVAGKVSYEQRLLEGNDESPIRAARYYDDTKVAITTGSHRSRPKLSDERRLIVCDHPLDGVRMWSPNGQLTATEVDLLDIAGNTMFCDQLLPVEAVEVGDTWEHSAGDLAGLLGLEGITSCKASSELKEANNRFARIELTADVEGIVDGTTTTMMIGAIYLVDTKLGRVTQFNLAIKETRKMGPVTPGVEAVAKMQIRIDPKSAPTKLTDVVIASIPDVPAAELLAIASESENLGVSVTHDRKWYMTADAGGSLTLRQIDDAGLLLAHCGIAKPAPGRLDPDKAMGNFRKEVQTALGEQFSQFTSEEQWITPEGYRAVNVTAKGKVDGVPVEWRSYLLADDQGERVSLLFTLEESATERFNDADRAIVDSVKLLNRK